MNTKVLSPFLAFLMSTCVSTSFAATPSSDLEVSQTPAGQPVTLIVEPYTFDVDGKTAQGYKVVQPNGAWGFEGVEGQMFNATVKNETKVPLALHWHGLILPNDQDGVPFVTQPPILPGKSYHYEFKLQQSGTYWMHSHYELQLQQQMSAPFIILDPNDKQAAKQQNVVMFLTDFSFTDPDTIMANLQKTTPDDASMKGMNMGASMPMDHGSSDQASAGMNMPMDHGSMPGMAMDLNDIKYDAFLTNYHTLKDPQIVPVEPGQVVRLRVIEGAAASNFFIHTGALKGTAIAVDGEPIHALKGSEFSLTMGQRMDILVTIPKTGGAFPILAQVEGTDRQTGLILATPGAKIPTVSETAATVAPAMTDAQELKLRAMDPLKLKPVDQVIRIKLNGTMKGYVWTMNGETWPKVTPLEVTEGQRVELVFENDSMMSHPMHLHGHVFEVVNINGQSFQGAMRDTVLVPPNSTVTVAFDADHPGRWLLHCHLLYHGEAGMMAIINYKGTNLPPMTAMPTHTH